MLDIYILFIFNDILYNFTSYFMFLAAHVQYDGLVVLVSGDRDHAGLAVVPVHGNRGVPPVLKSEDIRNLISQFKWKAQVLQSYWLAIKGPIKSYKSEDFQNRKLAEFLAVVPGQGSGPPPYLLHGRRAHAAVVGVARLSEGNIWNWNILEYFRGNSRNGWSQVTIEIPILIILIGHWFLFIIYQIFDIITGKPRQVIFFLK